MRETRFISQNKKNWEEFEDLLDKKSQDPEKLSELFVQITDDLAYSRTHYPNRAIRVYLNNLARKIFSAVYRKRKKSNLFKDLFTFFKEDAPALVWRARYEMLICLIVFIFSFIAGVVSSRHDTDFPTYILGSDYVAMTEKNIAAGDPMAVYKEQHEATMFMGISYNNLFVSFRVYVYGILFGIGSLALLIYNGIMVGTFQYFFVPRGVFAESFATIWLHGVPEIFAIIFSSAAGLRLARGLIFPDTYSRIQSFQNSAWESLRLMICIVPVFLFAAFIEGFVTRYTELPIPVRIGFIILNFLLIVTYFVLYPLNKARKGTLKKIKSIKVLAPANFSFREGSIYSPADIVKGSLSWFGANIKWILRFSLLASLIITCYFYFFPEDDYYTRITDHLIFMLFQKLHIVSDYSRQIMYLFNILSFSTLLIISIRAFRKHFGLHLYKLTWQNILAALISISLLSSIFFIDNVVFAYFLWCFTFPSIVIFNYFIQENSTITSAFNKALTLPFTAFIRYTGSSFLLYLLFFLFSLLVNSPLFYFYQEIISWNFGSSTLDNGSALFNIFCNLFATYLFSPFLIAGISLLAVSLNEIKTASSLKSRINSITGR